MDILTSIAGNFSQDTLNKVATAAGIDPAIATKAFGAIAPLMVGKMADNAQAGGAEALNATLDKHDGSIFDSLGDLSGKLGDGEKILGHVFGGDTTSAVSKVASQTGMDSAQAQKLMMMVAPLILGALGKAKKTGGMDTTSLVTTLGGLSSMMGGSGNLASVTGAILGGGSQKKGGLGDILGMLSGILGKK